VKIALCIPVHGDPKAHFAKCYGRLIAHSSRQGREIESFVVSSAVLSSLRALLVRRALEWKADWLLWMDADHTFPPDALERLLAHDLPIVGCNYIRRLAPHGQTASVETTREKAEAGMVEPANHMGLGLCLMRADVFDGIDEPLFDGATEDIYLFNKLRAARHQPHVDHALSMEVGHIAETVLRFGR
jgi:hypothetical protein